jgi:hypothetical protein
MAGTRVIPAVTLTAGTPTPIYTGTIITASSFSILNGIATIVLSAALADPGYNPPSYWSPEGGPPAGARKVVLWGFSTATYFNGETVDVISMNKAAKSFSFNTTHANVSSTADTGNTAPQPVEQYRSVRLEVDQAAGAALIYVGDLNVSSTRYAECLSLTGQIAVTILSGAIPADRIFCDCSGTCNVQVSLMY